MKTVCMLVQAVYDYDARVRRKAEALVAAGYSVDVLALRPPSGNETYTLKGVTVHTIALPKARGSLGRYFFEYVTFFLWAAWQLVRLMPQRKYAVVDVNTLPDFLIFAAAPARWMGAKLILDMHELAPEFTMSKYGLGRDSKMVRLVTFLERISFNFADGVLTISEPVQDLFVGRGLSPAKAAVLMNAADESRFAGTLKQDQPGRPAASFVMVYHGTLTPLYGLDIAIEAFRSAHAEMPGAEFWILGEGTESGRLRALVEQYGLGDKVKLVGLVPSSEIPEWLSRCDVGVLPIRRDVFLEFAFPNKLPEFIIAGKPVLMARLKVIRHYFSEDALAYFEPNDPGDLARQMVRLYKDRAIGPRLTARAREEYAPIRWEPMKQRYLTMVAALAGEERSVATSSQQAKAATLQEKA